MSWKNNMTVDKEASVTDYEGEDYTRVTFKPDLKRFGLKQLNGDLVSLFKKRVGFYHRSGL